MYDIMSVDDEDKEILRILIEDAKTSAKEIGEKIDSPITTVYSRMKRLEDTSD
jgi:DNA-binding Lrp family transcriptional regulator